MWGILESPQKGIFGDVRAREGSGTIFFRKLAVTVDGLGFFLPVQVRFQRDCTAP